MARDPNGADLERLLAERGVQLMAAAIALSGGRQGGEDLLQAALARAEAHLRPCHPRPGTSNMQASISKALSCKLFVLDGRQQVNGVNAIRLTFRPPLGLRIAETLWVDPSTYLPVRASVHFLGAHGQGSLLIQDYQWLPPTRANLAALHAAIRHATIPDGFRKLRSTYLPLAGFGS
jgi:hypothetical protein